MNVSTKWDALNARLQQGAMKQRAHTRRVLNDDPSLTLAIYQQMKDELFEFGVPAMFTVDDLKARVTGARLQRNH